MKIIDLLTPNQVEDINKLVKSYKTNSEFEVSIFSNKETSSHLLSLEKFNDLNSVLSKITSKNESKYQIEKTQVLDVIMSIKDSNIETKKIINFRASINGLETINKYMSMLHGRKNHLVVGVLSSFYYETRDNKNNKYNKITIIKKTKNV